MLGAFAGGGKYSLMDARGVVAKWRLLGYLGRWERPQLTHGFKYDVLEPSTRVCMAWES